MVSCSEDSGSSADNSSEESEIHPIAEKTIFGVAQKRSFAKGSTVSVYELDENFEKTDYNIETNVKNDQGEFSVKLKDFESQHVLLKVNGRCINDITGAKSADNVSLYAFTDLGKHDTVNINILTHLSHKRALYLASNKDIPVAKAKKQAESEVLKAS